MLTTAWCLLVWLGLLLMSGWLMVILDVLLSVVIVTLPYIAHMLH